MTDLLGGGALATGAGASSPLPTCPSTLTWPHRSVSTVVLRALDDYYAARHLTPLSVVKGQMWILNVTTERVGVHWCRNTGGGKSGYVGVVPKTATAAVLVEVTHHPYPVTDARTTFATVARESRGWVVVSDDTAP